MAEEDFQEEIEEIQAFDAAIESGEEAMPFEEAIKEIAKSVPPRPQP